MKKVMLVIALVAMFAMFSQALFAQSVTINLSDLSPEEAQKVLAAKKLAENPISAVSSPEKLEEWVTVGEKIGQAIAATCNELSVGVNEFIDTPAGKITVLLISWKIVGEDLWGIVGGCLAWIVISAIILWSFRHFHMNEKIKDKKTGTVEYLSRYNFSNKDNDLSSAIFHAIAFVLFTIICLLIVF